MEPQEVTQNTSNTTPNLSPIIPSSFPEKNFPLIIVFSLLLLGLIGGMAYFLYQNNLLNQQITLLQQQTNLPTPIITQAPTPSSTSDPTVNWKTYSNDPYKLSFKYPMDFNIEIHQVDTSNYVQVIFDKSLSSSFTVKASTKYPPNQPRYLLDTESVGTKNINGKLWSLFELPGGSLGMQLEENLTLYSIIYPVSEKAIVDQILSTFKFTE